MGSGCENWFILFKVQKQTMVGVSGNYSSESDYSGRWWSVVLCSAACWWPSGN